MTAHALKSISQESDTTPHPVPPTRTRAEELSALRSVGSRTIDDLLAQRTTFEQARAVIDGANVLLDLYELEQVIERKEQHERKK